MLSKMTTLLVLLSLNLILPCLSSGVELIKRNPCDWEGALPVLYKEYREEDCPANIKLLPGGSCGYPQCGAPCGAFCQVRTNFYWGQEQPFLSLPVCGSGQTCKISSTDHTVCKWKVKCPANAKFGWFNTGVGCILSFSTLWKY